jgi:hypothetical protein
MKFSKLAILGDLRQYSFNELGEHLKNWKFTSTTQGDIITAQWSNVSTTISILYTLEGKFIQILEERWKSKSSPDTVFRRDVNK